MKIEIKMLADIEVAKAMLIALSDEYERYDTMISLNNKKRWLSDIGVDCAATNRNAIAKAFNKLASDVHDVSPALWGTIMFSVTARMAMNRGLIQYRWELA